MRILRSPLLGLTLAAQLAICTAGAGVVTGNLRHLSGRGAESFLENVRSNSFENGTRLTIEFKLHAPARPETVKFGTVEYSRSGDSDFFAINFEGVAAEFSRDVAGDGSCNIPPGEPFFDGLILAPADMGFIFPGPGDYAYLGPAIISGRRAQEFLSAADISIGGVKFESVKISIDEKFMVVLRVDFFDSQRKLARRMCIGSFGKFDGIWMPKTVEFMDFRDHRRAKLEIFSVKT
jgi:hypothetical protein